MFKGRINIIIIELILIRFWFRMLRLLNKTHPLKIALLLTLSSLCISFYIGFLLSSWVRISLSLVFLGGIIVIFLYFSRLVANEKFLRLKTSHREIIWMIILIRTNFIIFVKFNRVHISLFNFLERNLFLLCLLIIYLLLTLLVVCEFSLNFKGSLEIIFF